MTDEADAVLPDQPRDNGTDPSAVPAILDTTAGSGIEVAVDAAIAEVAGAGCSGCSCSVVIALGVALSAGSAFAVHLIR